MTEPASSWALKNRAGVVPLGRRSVRFASGDTKEAATAQPNTDALKIGPKPLYVNHVLAPRSGTTFWRPLIAHFRLAPAMPLALCPPSEAMNRGPDPSRAVIAAVCRQADAQSRPIAP